MDMTCYTCGDRGYTQALVVCDKCEGFSVHRYCMNVIVLTEEIKWSCEYCEANINAVEQCEKVFKDAEIRDFNVKRKRDGETNFCQDDENAVLQGREENGSSTTTSLDTDSQDWSKKGPEKNPGVRVNRKRRKEKGHHLDSNIGHVNMVEREPILEKSDENKLYCTKKSDLTEKEAFVMEAVCGEIQGDNFEIDRVVQIHKYAPTRNSSIQSCCIERECMGNEGNFSKIQVGRPEQNVTPVTSESATIAISLPESDSDPKSTSKNIQIQGIGYQCIVSGRSTGQVCLVDKPSDVQNSLDLVSQKDNQSTTLEFLPVIENDSGASRYSQFDRTSLAVSAGTVAESGRNKPSKSNKNATAGDTQIGVNQRISLTQPTPSENVKSVHKHRSAQTLVEPRINRANFSPQSEPMHKVPRSNEQENHGLRSRKINYGPVADTKDRIHRPRDACNVARRFRRRWDVRAENVDQIPEFHDRSSGGLRGNSTDLVRERSFEPELHNFGYVPVHSLFYFIWNGWFKIDGTQCVRMGGHTSASSPVKYKAVSKSLPQDISLEKVDPGRVDITALQVAILIYFSSHSIQVIRIQKPQTYNEQTNLFHTSMPGCNIHYAPVIKASKSPTQMPKQQREKNLIICSCTNAASKSRKQMLKHKWRIGDE